MHGILWLLANAALAQPPDASALEGLWAARRSAFASAGLPTPPLTDAHWAKVAGGGVAKLRVTEDGADRAVGARWMSHSPEAVWIAILDDTHDTIVGGLTEQQLAGTVPGHKVLYQHLDLPRPFDDRHWVLVIENNPALYAQGVWEREWTLDPRMAGALVELPAALGELASGSVYTPINEGGWWLIPGEGGVLVVYQVRTDIGGNIPEELVLRYAMSTLDEMMEHVDERAGQIPAHYDAAHFPILRADNSPIPADRLSP